MAIEKILVADDDEDDRELVRQILQREGYRVEEATSGESALESVRSAPPDLVISKMFARDNGGIVLVRRIRAGSYGSTLPILAYTPLTDQTKLEALEAGVNDFLTRPFHAIELLARTRALLVTRHALRKVAEMNRAMEVNIGPGVDREWFDSPGDVFDQADPEIHLEEGLPREAHELLEDARDKGVSYGAQSEVIESYRAQSKSGSAPVIDPRVHLHVHNGAS